MSQAEDQMQAYIDDLNKRHAARQRELERMSPTAIKKIARKCGLPDDLNTSENIKYILAHEFSLGRR